MNSFVAKMCFAIFFAGLGVGLDLGKALSNAPMTWENLRPKILGRHDFSGYAGEATHKTIAFDATQYFSCLNLFCRFLFCHVTFDFTDVCALDIFFRRLVCWARFDLSFCWACLVSDLGQT